MISPNFLIKASRKASKIDKSLERTHDLLLDEMSRIRNVYFSESECYEDDAFNKKEGFLLVEMIDSLYNFSRSIPAFGMILTYIDYSEENNKHYAYSSIIDILPINQIFIFQDSHGGYIEDESGSKKRVYAKRSTSVELILSKEEINFDLDILTKSTQLKINRNFEDGEKDQNNNKNDLEFRNFGSDVYHIFLMLSNKADAVLLKKPNLTIKNTSTLIAKEIGLKFNSVGDFRILKN